MDERDLAPLYARFGESYVALRLRKQRDLARQVLGVFGKPSLHHFYVPSLVRGLNVTMRLTGTQKLGVRNALRFRVHERPVRLPRLPRALEGLRILHLSDLHIDGYPGFGRHIAEAVRPLAFDLAVITGDFRFHNIGSYTPMQTELVPLIPALRCRLGVYGVMGNHEVIQMVPVLERMGVRMLVNESAPLDVGGAALWLVGLDDPYDYETHDLSKALEGVPDGAPRILLVHSPELYNRVDAARAMLYLAGHTHGGQVCLPGGRPVVVRANCSRRYATGAWQHNGMQGYVSAGVGAAGVFARFFCPPEIVVHVLTRE